MRYQKHRLRGMTAIEVLAATVLASLMLTAVAGLLGGLARQERILRASSNVPHWQQQLVGELKRDLENTRQFIVAKDGVRLEGFAARDFVTDRPTGRAAAIHYFLKDTASGRWLVRRETHPDEMTNSASRMEIVCRNIERLQFAGASVDQVAATSAGPIASPGAALVSLPDRIAIQLYEPGSAVPILDRTFHLR